MKLNLGCGKKILKDYINVDILDYGQEIQEDARQYLESWSITNPGEIDEIRADHFIEHFDQKEVIWILNTAHMALKTGGIFRIEVPSIQRPEAYFLVHKTLFTLETFTMLIREEYCTQYGITPWASVCGSINNRGNINVILTK